MLSRGCVDRYDRAFVTQGGNHVKNYAKRKAKPWHLSAAEIKQIETMDRTELIRFCIEQKEQVNRVLRVLVKLKQAITELAAMGG